MEDRKWFNNDTSKYIQKLNTKFPETVISHMLVLIDEMDTEGDDYYCRTLVRIVHNAVFNEDFRWGCSKSDNYDVYHEFCYFLDGWAWNAVSDEEQGDVKLRKI